MEEWQQITEFPDYSVSNHGRVRNDDKGRLMSLSHNQRGVTMVGLFKNPTQFKRSVPVLVAEAFLPKPINVTFDTPIHLDGEKHNNYVDNLMWRPMWFARKYQQQFPEPIYKVKVPIIEIHSGVVYDDGWHAARTLGLLSEEILLAVHNEANVFPFGNEFRILQD